MFLMTARQQCLQKDIKITCKFFYNRIERSLTLSDFVAYRNHAPYNADPGTQLLICEILQEAKAMHQTHR